MAEAQAAVQSTAPRAVFSQRPFRTLWVAQFISIFGDFLALFGVISLITFRLHGGARDVTTAVVAATLPLALIAPFAGVFADRWPAKRVLVASDLLRAALATSLVFARDVQQIAFVLAGISIVSSFFAPAQSIALRRLVAKEQLLSANALLAQAFFAVRILSPAVAGGLVSWLGERACFWVDGASFVFSAVLLGSLALSRTLAPKETTLRSLANDFAEGNRFIFTHRGLTFAFCAIGVAMLVLSSFSPLISIYVRDQLHGGPLAYGLVSSMVGVGLIVGSALAARAAGRRAAPSVIVPGLFGVGAGAALLGAIPHPIGAAAGTFTLGLSIAFVMVPGQTLSQTETPHELMGRVSSTFMSLFSFSQVLGLLMSGALAERLGVRNLFFAAACAMAVLATGARLWMGARKTVVTAAQT